MKGAAAHAAALARVPAPIARQVGRRYSELVDGTEPNSVVHSDGDEYTPTVPPTRMKDAVMPSRLARFSAVLLCQVPSVSASSHQRYDPGEDTPRAVASS